jgi:hypothetical protein
LDVQAINIAILTSSLYDDIQKSCYGIVFLSTPHRGSEVTTFPNLLGGIANLATPGLSRLIGRSRTELIQNLKKDASELEKLSLDFSERLFRIKVASFIEQLKTPSANTRVSLTYNHRQKWNADNLFEVVDNTTGIIGSPGERRVSMQGCNHHTVCRFSTRDNNYGLVLGILQEWSSEATGGETGS